MKHLVEKHAFKAFAVLAFVLAFFVGGSTASKADVVWNVNAVFNDGTTLTGTFTTDVYGFIENNYSLTTQAKGAFSGLTYTSADSYFNNGTFFIDLEPGYHQDLHLTFLYSLGVANPNNPIVGGSSSFECQDSFTCYLAEGGPVRFIDSGFASAVPEPATWAMMLMGFLALGLVGHRRSRRQRTGNARLQVA
jgi:hypothetical protein